MAQGCLKSENEDVSDDLEEPLLLDNGDNTEVKFRGCDRVTPYESCGLFSILTFSWLTPLFALGIEKTALEIDDIPQLGTSNSVFGAFPLFQTKLLESSSSSIDNLNNNSSRRRRGIVITEFGLVKAYLLSTWKEVIWTGLMALINTLARFVAPYLIDSFVQCLNGRDRFKNEGYILALIFCGATFLQVFIQRHLIFKTQQIGIRLRAVTTVMIYNKCLNLPSRSSHKLQGEHGRSGGSGGELMNAVAVDVEKIQYFVVYMHDTWLILLQISLALLILYKKLGLVASIGAFSVTLILMTVNTMFMKWQEKFQKKLMESKDNRMKVTIETLKNMRVLRFQGWESSFLSKILQLRKIELQWLKKYLYSSVLISFFYEVGPTSVALVAFGSCIYMGIPLKMGNILSALATFGVLQGPIFLLPDTISMLIQAKVSLHRIASLLSLDELEDDGLENLPFGSSNTAIEVVNGNFTWDVLSSPSSTTTTATLKDINFKVSHGMKVAICGAVGSGKSSLLSCILGEMGRISGDIKLCGTKAYVAQSPWIQSGTVQENILFGKEMDLERYDQVLEACCLKKDLEILSFGDQTVIGERGINLSGGQKQRIQIARALYHDVDVYLFDDPFSAVDAHTGSHLFKEVLLGLLSEKTVIYVTHQIEFLNNADLIVVMKNGSIAQVGKYNDIHIPGSEFTKLVGAQNAAMTSTDTNKAAPNSVKTRNENVNGEADDEKKAADLSPASQLVKEEEREKGRVGFSVHWTYITTAYGGVLVLLMTLVLIISQILQIGSNYWLTWATPSSKGVKPIVSGPTVILVYASLAISICFCTFAVEILVVATGYKTATLLFTKMLQRIFCAPMSFFDATPTGRILNRCSTDQSAVEKQIPRLLESIISSIIQLLGTIALMSMVSWQVLIIFIPLIFASFWYQQYYMPSSRELSRLSRVCEAPVIQYFSETMSGITTIRSFDQESRFQPTYMKIVDAYSRPEFHLAAAMKWLMFRLDALSCITFAFLLLSGLIWCLCHWETKMISVERILQYMTIPSEAPLIIQENRPDYSWPSNGDINIHNLQVQYAPHLPLVLHGVTCSFSGGKKTGIVGRTGSGKSTLIQALFRIVEPTAGRIVIDGIDISTIGLQDLRSNLSIIPQDPTIVNLEMKSGRWKKSWILMFIFHYVYVDVNIMIVLCLQQYMYVVDENGENWSMGQRQLVCIGRVLLKKSKVLVLDEATASVDTATDNLIQQTLKHQFADCTLITIAHRITSVLDSNMVLLLSHGLVEEYDSPTNLLRNKSSSFSKLVAEYTA
ncbi:ABC transporter C family member 3, partial [Bienertia sinuspersici]